MQQLPIDAQFDEPFANQIARLETFNKHHYRPNSYLHKWWARRCGSTFRLILKHLVEDKAQRDYYTPGGLAGKVILDPMMGGGTTLHEAIRLGATVLGADLDPVPVLQARATLSRLPLAHLESAFASFFAAVFGDVGALFETVHPETDTILSLWYTLYGLRRHCDCGEAVLVDSFVLRQKRGGGVVRICPESWQVFNQEVPVGQPVGKRPPLVEKAQQTCTDCGKPYRELVELPYFARYAPIAIAAHGPGKSLFFKSVEQVDVEKLAQADAMRRGLPFQRDEFMIRRGRKTRQLHQRGVSNYLDLFSSRQLLYLASCTSRLPQHADLEKLNLGLLVSTSLEFNSMLCGYKGRGRRRAGAIRHAFAHHAYAFPYTALENNPVYHRSASGGLKKLFRSRIRNGRLWADAPKERVIGADKARFKTIHGEKDFGLEGELSIVDSQLSIVNDHSPNPNRHFPNPAPQTFFLHHGTATNLPLSDGCVDAVVTDPPYYDSVQYSDLSAFFRVWLRQLLPDAAEWHVDLRESAVDPHHLDRESRYRELMTAIFCECYRVVRKDNGRLIFTFHHWNPKAWIALVASLRTANFRLVNRYVVISENPISVHINRMRALLHDVILVLAPVEAGVAGVWERPYAVDTGSSEQFCRDCGTLLGWSLAQRELSEAALASLWKTLLRE